MSVDIRRMTKEELDALNEQGRLWRARNKPAQGEQVPDAERFGLCAKHLKQIKDKKRRLRARMTKR